MKINGLIHYFTLEDWWLNDLTKAERDRLIEKFGEQLTTGNIYSTSKTKLSMLCNMSSFSKPNNDDLALAKKIREKAKTIKPDGQRDGFWQEWLIENELH